MKVVVVVKEWQPEASEWVPTEITFHKVPQEWQSCEGGLIIQLKEVVE